MRVETQPTIVYGGIEGQTVRCPQTGFLFPLFLSLFSFLFSLFSFLFSFFIVHLLLFLNHVSPLSLPKTEKMLINQIWTAPGLLQTTMDSLQQELTVDPSMGRDDYRTSLINCYFYKYYLHAIDVTQPGKCFFFVLLCVKGHSVVSL